jgi:hypothetical protein
MVCKQIQCRPWLQHTIDFDINVGFSLWLAHYGLGTWICGKESTYSRSCKVHSVWKESKQPELGCRIGNWTSQKEMAPLNNGATNSKPFVGFWHDIGCWSWIFFPSGPNGIAVFADVHCYTPDVQYLDRDAWSFSHDWELPYVSHIMWH